MDEPIWPTYQTKGAALVRALFPPSWMDRLRGVAEEILDSTFDPTERLSGAAKATSRSSDGMWRRNETFARFLSRSAIADMAGAAMDSQSVVLYEDLFLYSEPDQAGAPWHRDAPHWPVAGQQLCSVWFSLEPVNIDTGALHFVAGSHRDAEDLVTAESLTMTLDPAREKREIFGFATEPGDAVVFHPRILHASLAGAPERPRRTFTIRFAGDDARWRPRSALYHPWMRELDLARGEPLDHAWFPVLRGVVHPVEPVAPRH